MLLSRMGIIGIGLVVVIVGTSPAEPPTPEQANQQRIEEARQRQREIEEINRRNIEEANRRQIEQFRQMHANDLCIAGVDGLTSVMEHLYADFHQSHPGSPEHLEYTGGGNDGGVRFLADRLVDAAVFLHPLIERQMKTLNDAFPPINDQSPLQSVEIGRYVTVVVVHKSNLISSLTLAQLEDVYRGKIANWSGVGGGDHPITRIGTVGTHLGSSLFVRHVLHGQDVQREPLPFRKEGYTDAEIREFNARMREKYKATGGKPYAMYETDTQVLKAVADSPHAIGYCLMPANGQLPESVKVLGLMVKNNQAAVLPTRECILLGGYPIQQAIRFVVRSDASAAAKAFIAYVCGEKGEAVWSDEYLFFSHYRQALQAGNGASSVSPP
ncbi:MAG: substrate-binding domain-containing protein [Phycisphaerales bacterium]